MQKIFSQLQKKRNDELSLENGLCPPYWSKFIQVTFMVEQRFEVKSRAQDMRCVNGEKNILAQFLMDLFRSKVMETDSFLAVYVYKYLKRFNSLPMLYDCYQR